MLGEGEIRRERVGLLEADVGSFALHRLEGRLNVYIAVYGFIHIYNLVSIARTGGTSGLGSYFHPERRIQWK